MKDLTKGLAAAVGIFILVITVVASTEAAMGGGMMGGQGMFGSGAMMSESAGGFGMMNGMMGAPVVGADGTAYLVSYLPTATPGTVPTSNSFTSTLLAVSPTGQITSTSLNGITSRPVLFGNYLIATTSIPDMGNYMMVGSFGTNPQADQSVVYIFTLPLTTTAKPLAVSLDGGYASVPVIANNRIYITTTDFGSAMMGNGAFTGMFGGNYNFNANGTAQTYLYIINLDGSAPIKVLLQ